MKRLGLLIPLLAASAWAQFSADDMLRPNVYTNADEMTFAYRLAKPQFPREGEKYPLIIFLHGSGECGTDNKKQIKVGVPTLISTLLKRKTPEPFILAVPQCQGGNWWVKKLAMQADYAASREPSPSMEMVLEIVRHLVAEHQADPDRLYITGLSLGGFGTWDAIQREPDLFAAAVPICGGGDIRRVRDIKNLPIWVFHGSDDKNVKVDCSRRMVSALKNIGNRKVKYTEYEGVAHNSWDRAYADKEMIEWLFKQTRTKRPWWKFW